MSKWYGWEIPLGIATGGASALAHLGFDTGKKAADYVGTNIGTALGTFSRSAVDEQQAFNSAEAQKQREWEEHMSNTAIQRQVADIEKAGLNPWLALNGGAVSGASTPSGASASSNSASAEVAALTQTNQTLVNAVTKLVTSAMSTFSSLAKLFG